MGFLIKVFKKRSSHVQHLETGNVSPAFENWKSCPESTVILLHGKKIAPIEFRSAASYPETCWCADFKGCHLRESAIPNQFHSGKAVQLLLPPTTLITGWSGSTVVYTCQYVGARRAACLTSDRRVHQGKLFWLRS